MAARPIWRGHLRLALVSCAGALYNARHDRAGIRFNLINPETGNRIRMITQDSETGQELERRSLVKGYEFRKGKYLLVSDDDLDSVKVDSSKVMTIEKFVDTASIDPVYYDSAYYLVPDGDAGKDVYAVLRSHRQDRQDGAVARGDRAARTNHRSAPDGRRPYGAHALRGSRPQQLAGAVRRPGRNQDQSRDGATQLVQRQSGEYDVADLEDRYETRLRAMIDAKLKGEGVELIEPEEPDRTNVVDLIAALKKSLGQEKPEEKKKAARAKKARAPDRKQSALKLPIQGGKLEWPAYIRKRP
jgi:DNA end-binding protein Ku